jgi:hypothetical protein
MTIGASTALGAAVLMATAVAVAKKPTRYPPLRQTRQGICAGNNR